MLTFETKHDGALTFPASEEIPVVVKALDADLTIVGVPGPFGLSQVPLYKGRETTITAGPFQVYEASARHSGAKFEIEAVWVEPEGELTEAKVEAAVQQAEDVVLAEHKLATVANEEEKSA